MRIKKWVLMVGCAALLCGCTKSNIIQPETHESQTMGPDFNRYEGIVLDEAQLHEGMNDIYLNAEDYPMASGIDFSLHLDEAYVDVIVIVKDGTSADDAAYYSEVVIKGLNDEVVVQDLSYGEADEDTFGGLYQDNDIRLKVYEQSAYSAGGEPMYETVIPMNTYEKIEIVAHDK